MYIYIYLLCFFYLNGSLLFADIVGLQLLRLWQCSADRGPETDSWDKRDAAQLLVMLLLLIMMMAVMITLQRSLFCLLFVIVYKNISSVSAHMQ